ncbi:MAG: hypothetical protein LBN27_05110 [Prevotellaceae bacterium]|nr:hypothetical protein [Prevotellaceae bacterium]
MEAEEQKTPKGRAALMESYRAIYPDAAEEIDDEALFDFAHSGLNDYKGKYDKEMSDKQKFAEIISNNPRLANYISMIAGGEHPRYAERKSFGKFNDSDDDDEAAAAWEKAATEENEQIQSMSANLQAYKTALDEYAAANGLDEEQKGKINDTYFNVRDSILMFENPKEIIDILYKGLDYDEAGAAALEAGKLEGANSAIEQMRSKRDKTEIPDLGGGGGAAKEVKKPSPFTPERRIITAADMD